MTKLDKTSTIEELVQSGVLLASVEMLPDIVMYCRPGSFDGFKAKVSAKLEEYVCAQSFGGGE
eukprot:8720613-Pyramimonas_sp.AAC.1